MQDFQYTDRNHSLLSYIQTKGYLYYFLKNFAKTNNGNIQNLKNLWIDITQMEFKKCWAIIDHQLCFQTAEDLYYNMNRLTFIGWNNTDNQPPDFFEHLSRIYCIPLTVKTIQNYMNITKDEYKNAWILDRSRFIVYFKFRNVCGEGAMKKTYLGWNINTNLPIVVYQINVPSNQIEQKRYLNEKRIGELKKSPYLLHIYYTFAQREYQKVFMISDYIPFSIKQLIDRKYIWSMEELKHCARQVLLGLKDLHHLNIIHRDIKPGNVLFDKTNCSYKIIDFGIATKYNVSSSHCIETINHYKSNDELSLVGTVGYIAPEIYKSIYNYNHKIKYDQSVDIFSFGVLLLEMATLQRAFSIDLSNICNHVASDLQTIEKDLKRLINEDSDFLKHINQHIEKDTRSSKKYDKVRIEIQEKIELIQQIEYACDDDSSDDKQILISELNDKNKSIMICCKKLQHEPQFHLLDQKTNEEHSLILRSKDLQNFILKLKQFEHKSIDDKVNDLLIYPLLFLSSYYEYPTLLQSVTDPIFTDFLKRCLEKDPSKRMSVTQLLSHDWIQ